MSAPTPPPAPDQAIRFLFDKLTKKTISMAELEQLKLLLQKELARPDITVEQAEQAIGSLDWIAVFQDRVRERSSQA